MSLLEHNLQLIGQDAAGNVGAESDWQKYYSWRCEGGCQRWHPNGARGEGCQPTLNETPLHAKEAGSLHHEKANISRVFPQRKNGIPFLFYYVGFSLDILGESFKLLP